jgi:hypothetical protein
MPGDLGTRADLGRARQDHVSRGRRTELLEGLHQEGEGAIELAHSTGADVRRQRFLELAKGVEPMHERRVTAPRIANPFGPAVFRVGHSLDHAHHLQVVDQLPDRLFRSPVNLRTSVLLWLVGAGAGRLAQSRVWRLATKDRDRAAAAALRILRWPIRRIAFAHGAACDGPDARPLLAHALRRMTASHLGR